MRCTVSSSMQGSVDVSINNCIHYVLNMNWQLLGHHQPRDKCPSIISLGKFRSSQIVKLDIKDFQPFSNH